MYGSKNKVYHNINFFIFFTFSFSESIASKMAVAFLSGSYLLPSLASIVQRGAAPATDFTFESLRSISVQFRRYLHIQQGHTRERSLVRYIYIYIYIEHNYVVLPFFDAPDKILNSVKQWLRERIAPADALVTALWNDIFSLQFNSTQN